MIVTQEHTACNKCSLGRCTVYVVSKYLLIYGVNDGEICKGLILKNLHSSLCTIWLVLTYRGNLIIVQAICNKN